MVRSPVELRAYRLFTDESTRPTLEMSDYEADAFGGTKLATGRRCLAYAPLGGCIDGVAVKWDHLVRDARTSEHATGNVKSPTYQLGEALEPSSRVRWHSVSAAPAAGSRLRRGALRRRSRFWAR